MRRARPPLLEQTATTRASGTRSPPPQPHRLPHLSRRGPFGEGAKRGRPRCPRQRSRRGSWPTRPPPRPRPRATGSPCRCPSSAQPRARGAARGAAASTAWHEGHGPNAACEGQPPSRATSSAGSQHGDEPPSGASADAPGQDAGRTGTEAVCHGPLGILRRDDAPRQMRRRSAASVTVPRLGRPQVKSRPPVPPHSGPQRRCEIGGGTACRRPLKSCAGHQSRPRPIHRLARWPCHPNPATDLQDANSVHRRHVLAVSRPEMSSSAPPALFHMAGPKFEVPSRPSQTPAGSKPCHSASRCQLLPGAPTLSRLRAL